MSAHRLRVLGLALLLAAATFAAYQPALEAGYVWDDDDYVTENFLLWEEDGLRRIWLTADAPSQYFPLVYTTYRLEYAIWGLDPAGYHAVNVALHVLNALLLWLVLVQMGVPGGFFAAAIFALHPVHVESVAWITERKNTLSLFFFLLALLGWLRFIAPGGGSRWSYLASLGSLLLSLFAKTTTSVFPAALVLTLWFQGRPVDRRRWLQIVPFVLIGGVMGGITILWERVHQGSIGERFEVPWPDVWIVASRAVWFYLGKLVWPTDLAFSYPRFEIDPAVLLQWVPLAAGSILVGALWLARERIGRAPLAATVFFVAALSPLLGFIALFTFQYTYVADHYQYIASLAPIALFAGIASSGVAGLGAPARGVARGVGLGLLLILGVLTHQQSRAYESRETLWRDTLAKNPESWMAFHNLGEDLLRQGRLDEAVLAFEGALELRDDLSKTHRNLGIAQWRLGRNHEASVHLEEAVRVDPGFYNGRASFAGFLVSVGRPEAASVHYTAMVEAAPRRPEGHEGLGRAQLEAGARVAAEAHFRAALRADPKYARAQLGLADVLATCPENRARVREAQELVGDVQKRGGGRDPFFWASAARLRAATGDRDGAVAALGRGLRLAEAEERDDLVRRFRRERATYESGSPWCPDPSSPDPD